MRLGDLLELHGHAVNCVKMRDYDSALRTFDKILLSHPDYTPGWQDRASLLNTLGAHFDSVCNWDRAIALSPKEGAFYCNRGHALMQAEEWDLAMRDFDKALEFIPNNVEPHNNIGVAYRRLGHPERAIGPFRKAIECQPDFSDAHIGLAMCLLELGQFEEGWREFEWRWKHESMVPRGLPHPVWTGERTTNPDDALLFISEQGHGDALQFIRYAKSVKERWGGKVYAEVRTPLVRVAQNIEGVDKVVVMGERVPDEVAVQAYMLSVPPIVGTAKGFHGPYIKPDPALVDYFGQMIAATPPGLRIGVCWAGMSRIHNPTADAIDKRRSLKLTQLAPLVNNGSVWISLQKGPPSSEVRRPPVGMTIGDITERLDDFWDTAALIANVDMVISVDSAVVHLAAAIGKPTWMLSRFDGCWRWHGDRVDSPWYPTLRQYRQKKDGDWTEPIEAMARDLQQVVVQSRKKVA